MRNFDLTPLYKSAIGFDRFANMIDEAMRQDTQPGYPPYNIELVDENQYRITMAVAGFANDELDLEVEGETLKITGNKRKDADQQQRHFLHQGIAERSFERRFRLADHVKVVSASLENGLLHIGLEREIPEALKPRKIEINGGANEGQLIDESASEKTNVA